jgi:hypothetical protein
MKDYAQNFEDFNRVGFEFLQTEIQSGCTFARSALQAAMDSDRSTRNTLYAKKAFDTACDLQDKLTLTFEQEERIQQELQELRSALLELGEAVQHCKRRSAKIY